MCTDVQWLSKFRRHFVVIAKLHHAEQPGMVAGNHPDDSIRDGNEALRLASRLNEQAKGENPYFLGPLDRPWASVERFAKGRPDGKESPLVGGTLGESARLGRTDRVLLAPVQATVTLS